MTNKSFIVNKISEFCTNNDKNIEISSAKYFRFPCCLGIDEAGQGPVLGPMVYAGVYIEIRNMEKLADIGLDDSKKLKEENREELFTLLSNSEKKLCGFEAEIISPNGIANHMLNVRNVVLVVLFVVGRVQSAVVPEVLGALAVAVDDPAVLADVGHLEEDVRRVVARKPDLVRHGDDLLFHDVAAMTPDDSRIDVVNVEQSSFDDRSSIKSGRNGECART